MKKMLMLMISILLILSLTLTGCHFPSAEETQEIEETEAVEEEEEQEEQETTEEPVQEETSVEEETIEVTHTIIPGEPGWIYKWFYDTDASKNAGSGYVTMGDDFVANLFERPFTETEMVYRPDLDIYKTEISSDDNFYYVAIYLNSLHADGDLQGIYGVEIDSDKDGRGDLLVIVEQPTSTSWDIAGVSAHTDLNHDVGGSTIMRPDSGYGGDGYENVVFSSDVLDDPDKAFARVALGDPPSVTIALKKSLVDSSTFVWGVWAADSLLDPALIDIHDNFTDTEAGSPYESHSNYPLAAVNLIDNTCRETYGFEPTVAIPGLCVQPEIPTATPEPTDTQVPPTPEPGTISGVVFRDINGNASRDSGEPLWAYSSTVTLYSGSSCSGTAINSTTEKTFSFTGLAAGTYCVKITAPDAAFTTATTQPKTVGQGESKYVEFGLKIIVY